MDELLKTVRDFYKKTSLKKYESEYYKGYFKGITDTLVMLQYELESETENIDVLDNIPKNNTLNDEFLKLLDINIINLDFSPRLQNVWLDNNIITLKDFIVYTFNTQKDNNSDNGNFSPTEYDIVKNILRLRNLGKKSFREIGEGVLHYFSLSFTTDNWFYKDIPIHFNRINKTLELYEK